MFWALGACLTIFICYVTYSYIMVCGAAFLNAIMALFAAGPAMIKGRPRRRAGRRLREFFKHAFLVFVYVVYISFAAVILLKMAAPGGYGAQVHMTHPVALLVLIALMSVVATGLFWWLKKELGDHTRQDLTHAVTSLVHHVRSGYDRGRRGVDRSRDLYERGRQRFSRDDDQDGENSEGESLTGKPVSGRPSGGRPGGRKGTHPAQPGPTSSTPQPGRPGATASPASGRAAAGAGAGGEAAGAGTAATAAEAGAAVVAPEVVAGVAVASEVKRRTGHHRPNQHHNGQHPSQGQAARSRGHTAPDAAQAPAQGRATNTSRNRPARPQPDYRHAEPNGPFDQPYGDGPFDQPYGGPFDPDGPFDPPPARGRRL